MNANDAQTMSPLEYSNAMTLFTMFRHFKWGTVVKVLKSVNNDLDRAIDKLLDMAPEIQPEQTQQQAQQSAQEPEPTQVNPPIDPARIAELEQQISSLEEANKRVEEEKKKAMQWCVSTMENMRAQIQQQEERIQSQNQQLQEKNDALKMRESVNIHLVGVAKKLQADLETHHQQARQTRQQQPRTQPRSHSSSTPDSLAAVQQALYCAKDFLADGATVVGETLCTFESGLRTEIKKIEKGLREEDILGKMKDIGSTLKEEISSALFASTANKNNSNNNSTTTTPSTTPVAGLTLLDEYQSMETEEEREAWVANVQDYVQQLEEKVNQFEELFQ
jgi:hypothetical protein